VTARLIGRASTPRRGIHPARLSWSDSGFVAEPVKHHGSGDLVAWRAANGMIRLPADTGAASGDRVEALLDRDFALR
jgi:molybdopterin biosynthesis enzyme